MKKTLYTLLFIFASNLIFAQADTSKANEFLNLSFEDLVNTKVKVASKKEESITDAPGIITVITKEEIRGFGANTLIDILHRIPSVMPISSHVYANNAAVFRGDLETHSDIHTLILLNGRPLREGVTGGLNNSVYTSFPIEIIERIEIIRGPGSVLYGTNAFTGVINIITKEQKHDFSFNGSNGYGSFNGVYNAMDFSLKKNKFEILISGQLFSEDGWEYKATTANPTLPSLTNSMKYVEEKLAIFSVIKYGNIRLTTFYSDNSDNMLGIIPYWTTSGTQTSQRLFSNLGYEIKISKNWKANFDVSYSKSRFDINYSDTTANHSADFLGEISVAGKISEKINLISGIVAELRTQPSVINETMPLLYKQMNNSGYLQFDYSPINNIKLIAGVQANLPYKGDIDFSPRLGAIGYFNKQHSFGSKILYSQAFRSAFPFEQYIDNPEVLLGNESLTPEKITTSEAQLFYNRKKLQLATTVFYNQFTNLISRVPIEGDNTGRQTFANIGEMDIWGLEFEAKAALLHNLLFTGSATYQKNTQSADDIKSLAPETIFKAGLNYNTGFGMSVGVFNTLYGKPLPSGGEEVNPKIHAINLLSANIKYRLPIKAPVEVSLYAQNLLNDDFYFTEFSKRWTNTLPMGAGRTIFGKVSIRISE